MHTVKVEIHRCAHIHEERQRNDGQRLERGKQESRHGFSPPHPLDEAAHLALQLLDSCGDRLCQRNTHTNQTTEQGESMPASKSRSKVKAARPATVAAY